MFEVITGSLRDLKMAKTMKECELCELSARLYCESDEASLCWDCDAKVHSANFLVAWHCRSLLCQIFQSVTAWRASGAKPSLIVSVCKICAGGSRAKSDGDDDEGGNNDENQVVPLASGYSRPPLSCSFANQEEPFDDERHCAKNPLSNSSPDAASHKRLHEILAMNTYEGDCAQRLTGMWAHLFALVRISCTHNAPLLSLELCVLACIWCVGCCVGWGLEICIGSAYAGSGSACTSSNPAVDA